MKEHGEDIIAGYHVLFGVLGKQLYLYPTQASLDALAQAQLFEPVPVPCADPAFLEGVRCLSEWGERHRAHPGQSTKEARIDATRLFAGYQSMAVPPWESVYFNRERTVFQKETLDVRSWYRRHGIQLVQKNHEPDDHIGYELDFLSFLLERELAEGQGRHLDAALEFAEEHPLRWAHLWSAAARAEAQTLFFRGVALMVPPLLTSFAELAGE